MGKHSSVSFNPNIARVFYRAGYIESWSRGIERICNVCTALGAELPEYQATGADTMVFFKSLQSSIDLGNLAEKVPQVIPQVEISKKADVEAKITDFCSVARSITEIAKALGYKDRKTVHVYLDPLIEQGRIVRTIPDKIKSSKQRYITIK